jgi:hypothetical protein
MSAINNIPTTGTSPLRNILKKVVDGVNPIVFVLSKNQSMDTNASELDPILSGMYKMLLKKLG